MVSLSDVAASPHDVARGRIWPVIVSALLVQKPLFWSLLFFVLLGFVTLSVCGGRTLWWSAVVGHVGSTLLVYAFLGIVWSSDADVFQAVHKAPDYGISAVSAAWLGATAAVSWRARGRTVCGKIATIVTVVSIALFAWMLRHAVNVLDVEHVAAFAIGTAAALRLAHRSPAQERRLETVAA